MSALAFLNSRALFTFQPGRFNFPLHLSPTISCVGATPIER